MCYFTQYFTMRRIIVRVAGFEPRTAASSMSHHISQLYRAEFIRLSTQQIPVGIDKQSKKLKICMNVKTSANNAGDLAAHC